MKYNNYDITTIYYSGYTITSAYGCGGYKVFDGGDVPPTPTGGTKFSAVYLGGETYSADCDGNTTLTSGNTKPSGYEYSAMTEATIGSCVTAIGDRTFNSCKSLSSITIPDSVTSIGNNAFGWCDSLTSVTIPDSVTSIGDSAFQFCNSLTSVTIPSGVTTIGKSALFYCSGLQSITVNAITPPTIGYGAFNNTNDCPIYVPCQSLEAYKTAWSDYESRIQCIEPVFDGKFKAIYSGGTIYSVDCDSNTSLTTAITKPSGYQYSAMTSAVIGDCITSIGFGAFWSCHSLSSITLPDSIVSIGQNAFYDCPMLTSITIPSGVTTIGRNAFGYCRSLTSIDIPDSVTSIGDTAFEDCKSLTSITIGSGLTTINNYVFSKCISLASITIPNTVTSIGSTAFDGCRDVTTLTIGSGVTSIGDIAFAGCSGLTSVTINAIAPPTLGSAVFMNTNDCPIYVPAESVNAYKSADGWSTYADRIFTIT